MTVEVATKISQLNVSLPGSGDSKSEGDDHIRLIKAAVLGTLTGCDTTGVTGFNVVTQATADSSTLAASTSFVAAKIIASVSTNIADSTTAATSKATPVDADVIPLVDSAASNTLKKLTWANLKATLFNGTLAGSFTTLTASSGLFVNGPTTLSATNTGQISYENPNTRYYIGDGTGYSFRFSKRIGSVTTDLVTITDSGSLAVTGSITVVTPALLGYGTNAGATVLQATDKGTTVTLNKPTGQITMNSAPLAAGASISFLLSNTLLSGTDTIIVNNSSALIANYSVRSNVTPSAAAICVKNESAGSLSDALVINFTIIKGSAT